MHKTIEAIWDGGKIIPLESLEARDKSRLLVIVMDEHEGEHQHLSSLRGKYKSQINSVDDFIKGKQMEKELDL